MNWMSAFYLGGTSTVLVAADADLSVETLDVEIDRADVTAEVPVIEIDVEPYEP